MKIKDETNKEFLNLINSLTTEKENTTFDFEKGTLEVNGIKEVVTIRDILDLKALGLLQHLETKIFTGRIKDIEKEKIKIEYYKLYVKLLQNFNNTFENTRNDKTFITNELKEHINILSNNIENSE